MKLASAFALLISTKLYTCSADCGPDGEFTIAGSTTVYPLATSWAGDYLGECPGVNVTVDGGGSSTGAKLVCGVGGDAAIGMMSRGWKIGKEAELAEDGFTYNCLIGDMGYSAAQIVVANDGVTVVAQEDGDAADCIARLKKKGGLSLDQLRWMFSNFTEEELIADGWDPKSIRSDGDDSTHLWSELHKKCEDNQIVVASPNAASGTYEFFTDVVITGEGETLRYDFIAEGGDGEVIDYIAEDLDAVGFVGYPLYSLAENVIAAPIDGVEPTLEDISSGTYSTLGRQIYMNLRTGVDAEDTVPYVEFGFSLETVEGYVPLSDEQAEEMNARLASLL